MQNNVSGNTILASLMAPSKNAGRDATSARKEAQEPRINFRDSMEQARLKVDARRDQVAARADQLAKMRADKHEQRRADKLGESRADQQAKSASVSESRAATALQKASSEHRASNEPHSDEPASTPPLQEKPATDTSKSDSKLTDAVNDPAADNTPQNANTVTQEAQALPPADLMSGLSTEYGADALAVSDPEAEGTILDGADNEAIAPLLAEAGLINVTGINLPLTHLPPTENGLAGFAKTSDLLKEGVSGGLLFGGDSSGNGKTGAGNMTGSVLNSMELTEDGLSLDGDLLLKEPDSSFSKLLAASREAHALLDPAPAKSPLAAVTSLVEAAPRLVETAAANRSFVVQTGVPTAMGQPGWSQAVGEKVLWLAAQNLSSAEIRLDPPELGPMQVRITIQNDQANVSFSSPHLVVREALDQSAARLREMFSEQGLNLADVDVSDQSFARQQARDESNPHSRRDDHAELENDVLAGTTDIKAIRLVDHYA